MPHGSGNRSFISKHKYRNIGSSSGDEPSRHSGGTGNSYQDEYYEEPSTEDEPNLYSPNNNSGLFDGLKLPLLIPDDAFSNGISFDVKLIGTLPIPRPSSRLEIITAMRRVRFEFKAKGVKKRKVQIIISVDGVKTIIRRKKKKSTKRQVKNKFGVIDPISSAGDIIIKQHPIYRIFYVSHDSSDVKVFSYIAREPGGTGAHSSANSTFHCIVFKAKRKQQHQQQQNTNTSSSSTNATGNNNLSSSPVKSNPKYLLSNFFRKKHSKSNQSKNDRDELQVYSDERRKSTISGNKPLIALNRKHQQGYPSATDRHKSFRIIEEDLEFRSKDPRKKSSLSNRDREYPSSALDDENKFYIEQADVDHKKHTKRNVGKHIDDNELELDTSEKQKQALKIVRTIGQAFEVSHQRVYSTNSNVGPDYDDYGEECKKPSDSKKQPNSTNESKDDTSRKDITRNKKVMSKQEEMENESDYFIKQQDMSKFPKNDEDKVESISNYIDSSSTIFLDEQSQNPPYSSSSSSSHPVPNMQDFGRSSLSSHPISPSSSTTHEIQLLHEKLEQQTISTESAIGQIHCLREQLQIEINARIEAQTRAHQLLIHNRELLNHLQMLVKHIKALEKEKEDSQKGQGVMQGSKNKLEPSSPRRTEADKSIFSMAQLKIDDYKAAVASIGIPSISPGSLGHGSQLNDENQLQLQKKSNLTLLSRSVSEKLPSKTVQIVCESDKNCNKKGYWSRHTTK